MVLFASLQSSMVMLAVSAIITIFLLRKTYRRIGRNKKAGPEHLVKVPRHGDQWGDTPRDAMAHVERQKVEMYDLSRELSGKLNCRIIVLEKLVGESQRQIERLEELLEESKRAKAS